MMNKRPRGAQIAFMFITAVYGLLMLALFYICALYLINHLQDRREQPIEIDIEIIDK